jgi:hypothetical protein
MTAEDDWQPPDPDKRQPPPYDWKRERTWPRTFDWEAVVFTVLACLAVLAAFWLLVGVE